MDYQKDTTNKDINLYGQNSFSNDKILINKDIFTFSYKKTEKLVTALYMVTDCMDRDDAMKSKIRTLSIDTLSYIHKLGGDITNPIESKSLITTSLMNIDEVISLINIARTIGYISDMNTNILIKELQSLAKDLKSNQEEDNHFTFTIDNNIFNLPRPAAPSINKSFNPMDTSIKDKRTDYNMSFTNYKSATGMSLNKGLSVIRNKESKEDRSKKIISILKDKKATGKSEGISIKDISIILTDCSEKTIQRELNILVSKGQVKKTGSKRWSKYALITN